MMGNTGYASNATLLASSCNGVRLNTIGGVWYTINPAAGTKVLATTCENSFFDTELALLYGGCNEQTCVTADDNACSSYESLSINAEGSALVWTADGSEYLLYVTGKQNSAGDFQLTVVISARIT